MRIIIPTRKLQDRRNQICNQKFNKEGGTRSLLYKRLCQEPAHKELGQGAENRLMHTDYLLESIHDPLAPIFYK